jgi:hypothetical protein
LGVPAGREQAVWRVGRAGLKLGLRGGLGAPRSHAMTRGTMVGRRRGLWAGMRTKLRERGQTRRRWRRITMKHIVILCVQVMTLCILASGRAWAATGKEGLLAKVDYALAVVSDEYFAYLAQGGGAALTPSNPLLRVSEGLRAAASCCHQRPRRAGQPPIRTACICNNQCGTSQP